MQTDMTGVNGANPAENQTPSYSAVEPEYIIYYVEKDIQLYIIYIIQEPLGIFSRVRAQCYLSSSVEDEVVSRGCWAEQPQSCSSSSFKECHF